IYAFGDITTSMTQANIDSTFQNWQSLDLTFDENATDLVFSFEIANMSTNLDNYVEIDYACTFNNNKPNVDYTFEADSYFLNPKGEAENAIYTKITITFNIENDELNVPDGTKVDMTIALKHQSPKLLTTTNNKYYYEDIEYSLNASNNTATVVGYQNEPTDVVIPAVISDGINNFVVTSVSDSVFQECESLTSINMPNSITSIDYYAFAYCENLTSVTIPDGVTEFGDDTFAGCTSLTSITIPDGITILEGTFCGCTNLTSVIIGKGVEEIIDGGAGGTFEGCTSLTSIYIPEGVAYIDLETFKGCANLISIVVSSENSVYDSRNDCNAIIEIESNTLIAGCKNTTIPKSVTNIGSCAFLGCTGLTSIIIGNNITNIGVGAFRGCNNLTSVKFENPNGWLCLDDEEDNFAVTISTTDFASNATLLTSTYCGYPWRRDA
ncbi:MAG: leucine-rich repeat domain-containing protein, partial [Clostridia bacterium]|nr:leucine-rich repeat domain-containing protein [Clostridia bacterium]